jgi:hypothetical protein
MLTIAETIYPDRYQSLLRIVTNIENLNPETSLQELKRAYQALESTSNEAEIIHTRFFLDALSKKLHGQGTGDENLYLLPDQGQQIRMFNLMAQKFPVVKNAQEKVNSVFFNRAQHEEHLLIFDVGLGTGQQVCNLLKHSCQQETRWKRVTVLGIEPSVESLQTAEARLHSTLDELGLQKDFLFLNKTVEQLLPQDWEAFQAKVSQTQARLLLNASFSLHHIKPPTTRTDIFKKLKAFNPEVFMIIEPYADFIAASLGERFNNAWHHYGLTFLGIDKIEASLEEKSSIKRIFFGREIQDVLAAASPTEQFETAEMWIERLKAAGFKIVDMLCHRHVVGLGIEESPRDGYTAFTVSEQPIVAVIQVE